jgi:hypothetical protein
VSLIEIRMMNRTEWSVGRRDERRMSSLEDELEDKVVVDPEVPRAVRAKGTRELARDPVEVLRMWPHSKPAHDPPAPPRPERTLPGRRRVEDKIVLAHLALDLYRETEQLTAAPHDASCATASPPCTSPRCAHRVDVLRGALIEACLLVQRVAMSTPRAPEDIEDRIVELLQLLE